ncbi:hypothetical protein PV11_01221 [Exophiala sideris]|uniref:RNase MRP protein 1 RNA binding domain-containing protein n=1 Tax=Exophiala sideris TaxID=1016849 RepID=A0A0D1XCH7_9EURO|nr:hypothetical protein PV11_01221 [Exophiala sideris]
MTNRSVMDSSRHKDSHNRVSKTRLTSTRSRKHIRPNPPRDSRPRHPHGIRKRDTKSSSSIKSAASTIDSGASTPSSELSHKLRSIKALLDKIWVRNKNQHRTQTWWKSLGMLRKAVTTLVAFNDEENHLRQQPGAGPPRTMDASQVRKRFEQESQSRRDRDIWNEWIRETLLPRAYLGFTGLIADTQFAHLGVVLVGILADVMSVVGAPTALKDEQTSILQSGSKSKPTSLKATSLRVTGPQSGELVERMYDSDDMGEVVERKDAHDGTTANVDDTRSTKAAESLPHKASPHADDGVTADEIDQDMHIEDTPATTPSASKDVSTIPTLKSRPTDSFSTRKSSKAPPAKSTSSKSIKDKTKKKGKKNAIDDLFAGLV